MNHYIDIKLAPIDGINAPSIMNTIFERFHVYTVKNNTAIAVSFPEYSVTLGETLRLHGAKAELEPLVNGAWLRGDADYCFVSEVLEAPNTDSHIIVKRVKKNSLRNKLKRSVRLGRMTADEMDEILASKPDSDLTLPFLRIRSFSTGQQYHISISQQDAEGVENGQANTFGLSTKESAVAVPKF